MKKQILFLRIAFVAGAVLDGIMVLPMLFPAIAGAMFGIADFHPGIEYQYAMGIGASLMVGWTVLLIWGFLKPVERKSLVLITAFPVVIGMVLANLYAVSTGIVLLSNMMPTFVLQGIIFSLFVFSFIFASKKPTITP